MNYIRFLLPFANRCNTQNNSKIISTSSSNSAIYLLLLLLIHVLLASTTHASVPRSCDSVTKKLTVVNESFTDILYLDNIDGCDVLVSNVRAAQIEIYYWTFTVTSGATRIRIQDVTCVGPNDGSTPCVLFNSYYDAPGAQIIIERVKFDASIMNARMMISVPLGFKNIKLFSVSECNMTWSAPATKTKSETRVINCGRGFTGVEAVEISSNTITVTSAVFNPTFRIMNMDSSPAQPGLQRSNRIKFSNNKIIMTAPTTDVGVGAIAGVLGGGTGLAITNVSTLLFQNNQISLLAKVGNTGSGNFFVIGIDVASFDNSFMTASGNILTVVESEGATGGLFVVLCSCASSTKSEFLMTNNTMNAKFTTTGASAATSMFIALMLRFTGAVSQLSSAVLINNNILFSGKPSFALACVVGSLFTSSNIGNIFISGGRIQTTSTVTAPLQVLAALIFFMGKVDTIQNINCSQASIFVQSVSSGLQQVVGVSFQAVAAKVNSLGLESCQFEYWAEVGSSATATVSSMLPVSDVEIKNIVARNCSHSIKYSGSGNAQAVAISVNTILQGVESILLDRNEVKISIEKSSVDIIHLGILMAFGSKLFGIENSSAPYNATHGRRPLLPINITIHNNHVIFLNPSFSVSSLFGAFFYSNADVPSASFFISNNKVDSYCGYLNGTGGEVSTTIAYLTTASSQSGTDSPLEFQLTSNEVISRGIYAEVSVVPSALLLRQLLVTTGKILVQNNSIHVNFSAPNRGTLFNGLVTFGGSVLMKDEFYLKGNKFVATFCSDLSKAGDIIIATLVVAGAPLFVDVGASLRVVGDFVQINGQPTKNGWSAARMVSFDNPIFSQNDRVDFHIHLENCTLIGNVDENYILHNMQGYNAKSLSQYELMYGNVELGFLLFAFPGGITTATTISVKLIGNQIRVVRCAVSKRVVIRFASFTQSLLAVSSLLIVNNSILVPTSASLFNPITTSPNLPNIISRLFLVEIVMFNNYDNFVLKSAPKILNNTMEVSRTGYTASCLVYPTSETKYDYSVEPWNRVTIVAFAKAAPFSVATPFEISGNKITATVEEANYVEVLIAKIWNMDLTILNDSSPALLMESNVIEIGKLDSFYHESWSSILNQYSLGADSVKIKRSNTNCSKPVVAIHNNSLVVSSFLEALDGRCAIFFKWSNAFSLASISVNNNFLSIQSIIATGAAPVRPQIGILVVVSLRNASTNNVDLQKFSSVQNLEVQNNFLEFGSCSAPNSYAGLCEIAIVTITPSTNSGGDLPMSVGKNVGDGNIVSGTLFLSAFSNNTIKLINNNDAQTGPIINSTEFYCFSLRVEYIYSISGASNIFGNRISLVSSSTLNNNNNGAVQRNSIYSSNSQVGIVSFSKCVNDCFIKNNTVDTSGLYFLWTSPSKISFFIAQINASTREFIPGLQNPNFVFENNSMKISTTASNENNNIQTSILRLFDAPPTRLTLISSSSISFDPTTHSSSVNPISILLRRNEIYSVVFTLQSTFPNIFNGVNKNDGIVNFLFLSTEGSVDLEEFRILASLNNNTEVSGSSSMSAMIRINRRNVSAIQLQAAESQLAQERQSKIMKNIVTSSSFSLSGNRLIKWPLKPNKISASSVVDVTARSNGDVLIPATKYSSTLVQDSFWTFGCNYWTSDIQKEFSLHTLFEMDQRQFKFNCTPFSWTQTHSASMSFTSNSATPSVENSITSSTSLTRDFSSSFSPTSSLSASLPPLPYQSPLRVIYDTMTTVTSLLSVATLSTTAAITAARSRSALHHFNAILYGNCGLDEESLSSQEDERADISSSPTTMKLSDGGYLTGLVIGNICFVVGIGIAWFGGNSFLRWIETKRESNKEQNNEPTKREQKKKDGKKKKKQEKTNKKDKHEFVHKLLDSNAHQMMFLFAILLLEPTLTSGATSFIGGFIVVGRSVSAIPIVSVFLAWVLLLIVGLVWPIWKLVYRRSDRYDEFEEMKTRNSVHSSTFPLRQFVHYMTDASGEWIYLGEKEKHKIRFKLAVIFFEWCSPTFPKFIIVDISVVVCLSLAEVIGYIIVSSNSACMVRGVIVCVAFSVHVLCLIFYRPVYTDRMSNTLSVVVEVLSIAMIAGALSMKSDASQTEAWSIVALTQSMIQSLVMILDLAAVALPIWDKILLKFKSKPPTLSEVMNIDIRGQEKARRNKNKMDDQEMELLQTPSPRRKRTVKPQKKKEDQPWLSREVLESHLLQTEELY